MVEQKKETTPAKKEKEYPIWPGNENAEVGVVYRLEKSGNLIQKGDMPQNG